MTNTPLVKVLEVLFQKAANPPQPLPRLCIAIERPGHARVFDDTPNSATRRKLKDALYHDNLRDGFSVPLARRAKR